MKTLLPIILILFSGCTFARHTKEIITGKVAANTAAIAEQSRALTTGQVDALSMAPTNKPVLLALDFAKKNQTLQGVPQQRIDVPAILSDDKQALADLAKRFKDQDALIEQKAAVEAKLKESEARLIQMGAKYEEEHNKTIVSRIWHWALGTLGIGGMIALFVFCPAVIPIFARILAWIVGMFPKLAGAVGVVGTKAFDALIVGTENGKKAIGDDGTSKLKTQLAMALDSTHKALVDARKEVVI